MSAAAKGSTLRLSRKLAALHVASIAVLALVVVASVLWVSVEHNKLASASSEERVVGAVAAFQRRMADTVRDYSVWDDAYLAIRRGDGAWLYSNIGSSATELGTMDLVVVVDPASGRIDGWDAESPVEGEADLLPPPLVAVLLAGLDAAAAEERAEHAAFGLLGGELWAFAVSAVRPVGDLPAGEPEARLPKQIHGMRMQDQLAGDFGAGLMVRGAHLAETADPGEAGVALRDSAGLPVARLAWTPPRPGGRILGKLALPLGLALLSVAVLAGVVARFIVRSARSLEQAVETAQAADRSKTDFLSTVSHELRTPMNGILGVAQLLELGRLDDEQRELVGVLTASANTQMSLIADLLDITRLEGGHREAACAPFEPMQVLREVVDLVRAAAARKQLAIETRLDALRGLRVEGDERAFRQVMTNLLGNAVKFTEKGFVRLEANMRVAGGRVALDLTVRDSGPGIAPEDHARIFDRFVQLGSPCAQRAEGTGLGLAISQKLAEVMGGRIEIDSAPGAGSTFTLRVAMARSLDEQISGVAA